MDPVPPIPALEYLFHVDARLGPIEDHGHTRAGHRRVVPIVGGTVSGAVEAEIVAGGADWQIVCPDGTVEIDTRYTLRTADGDLVHLRTRGLRTGPPAVLEAVLRGELVAASDYYFRLVVDLESAAPALDDLQRSIIVAAGARTADRVIYDAYRVT